MAKEIKVLLVEDDQAQRSLMAMLLETMEGLHLIQAADGLEGLELAWAEKPDVIVLDLILPIMSGMEMLKRYRRGGGGAGVLVLSKAGGEPVHAAAIAAGADFFLCKPALWTEVRRAIRFLAGGLTRSCEELLTEMGAPDLTGLRQAARCAGALGEQEGGRALLKEAYWRTAREERTSVTCVEKNIRKLIRALAEEKQPLFQRLFGKAIPSNKRFLLALVREAVRREE